MALPLSIVSPGDVIQSADWNDLVDLANKFRITTGKLEVLTDVLVEGNDDFDATGETATLCIGDDEHYIRAEKDFGLTIAAQWAARGLVIRKGGDTGIGTDNPGAKLDLHGGDPWTAENWNKNLRLRGDAPALIFTDYNTSTNNKFGIGSKNNGTKLVIFSSNANVQDTAATPTNHLVIQEDGKVGIGTTAPESKLEIKDNTTIELRLNNTQTQPGGGGSIVVNRYANFWAINSAASYGFGIGLDNKGAIIRDVGENILFQPRIMVFDQDNVGIGTSLPTARLEIGPISGSDLQISNRGWDKAIKLNHAGVIVFDTGPNKQKYFIGGTGYDQRLYFSTIQQDSPTIDPIYAMWIADDGLVSIPNLSASSDRRLKKNIYAFKDGLSIVSQLDIKQFEYNGLDNMPTDQSFIGLIAQEVEKIAPFLVSKSKRAFNENGNDNSGLLSLRENQIKYVMINAIKELDKKLNNVNAQLKELSRRNKEPKMGILTISTRNTKTEIKAFLDAQGITYPARATKSELLQLINNSQA